MPGWTIIVTSTAMGYVAARSVQWLCWYRQFSPRRPLQSVPANGFSRRDTLSREPFPSELMPNRLMPNEEVLEEEASRKQHMPGNRQAVLAAVLTALMTAFYIAPFELLLAPGVDSMAGAEVGGTEQILGLKMMFWLSQEASLWIDASTWRFIALTVLLISASIADWTTGRIPNELVLLGGLVGAVLAVLDPGRLTELSLATLASAGGLFCLSEGWGFLFGARGFGMGDVKLVGAIGLLSGWTVLGSFYVAVLIAGLVGGVGIGMGQVRRTSKLPFAPFLACGVFTCEFVLTGNVLTSVCEAIAMCAQ